MDMPQSEADANRYLCLQRGGKRVVNRLGGVSDLIRSSSHASQNIYAIRSTCYLLGLRAVPPALHADWTESNFLTSLSPAPS